MIDYKKLQKGMKDGSQQVFTSETAMRLKETLKADSDKAGVAILGGGFGTLAATTWATSGIAEKMFSQFGYSGDTMTIAMNLGVVGMVAGTSAYAYSQIPNREALVNPVVVEQNTEERKSDKLVEDTLAFTNINKQAMESDHLYVSASSGSGKTTWANHCLNNHLPDNAQFIVLDPKPEGIQNGVGSKWENAHTIINDVTKFAGTLEKVVGLMLKRQGNPEVDNTLLFVIVDEATLLDSEAIKHATRLLTTGRSANIRLHMYTQSPSAELNNIKGLTQLFQTIPTLTLYKNEHGQRVIQAAKIISGKLKNLGRPIAIPYLEATWVKDLVVEDDSQEWDFGSSVVVASETVEIAPKPAQNNATTATTTATDDFMLKFMDIVSDEAGLELDSTFATQIGTAIVKLKKNGEGLSYEKIQEMAGMKRNSRQNTDISVVKEYMGVS